MAVPGLGQSFLVPMMGLKRKYSDNDNYYGGNGSLHVAKVVDFQPTSKSLSVFLLFYAKSQYLCSLFPDRDYIIYE